MLAIFEEKQKSSIQLYRAPISANAALLRARPSVRPFVRVRSSSATRFPRFSRAPAKVMVCSRSALTPVGSREHTVEEVHNRRGRGARVGGGRQAGGREGGMKGRSRGARGEQGGLATACTGMLWSSRRVQCERFCKVRGAKGTTRSKRGAGEDESRERRRRR